MWEELLCHAPARSHASLGLSRQLSRLQRCPWWKCRLLSDLRVATSLPFRLLLCHLAAGHQGRVWVPPSRKLWPPGCFLGQAVRRVETGLGRFRAAGGVSSGEHGVLTSTRFPFTSCLDFALSHLKLKSLGLSLTSPGVRLRWALEWLLSASSPTLGPSGGPGAGPWHGER